MKTNGKIQNLVTNKNLKKLIDRFDCQPNNLDAFTQTEQEILLKELFSETQIYVIPEDKPKPVELPKFSYFKAPVANIYPLKDISLIQAFKAIKSDHFAALINQLRSIEDKTQARQFKATKLPYFTFSGTFEKRNDDSLKKHSGYACLDFDHVPNVQELKAKLVKDRNLDPQLIFVSPTGNGLKCVVNIDLNFTHTANYDSIKKYILAEYKIEIDKTQDVSRACFVSFDPDCYLNSKISRLND